jgi:cytochrome c oxidase subunit 1
VRPGPARYLCGLSLGEASPLSSAQGYVAAAGPPLHSARAQLMGPDNHMVSDQQYNELFTMHGAIMLVLFATPLFIGFANEIMPL